MPCLHTNPHIPTERIMAFFALENFCSQKQKFFLLHGTFTPRNFRSLELSLPGAKVAGTFAPKNERSSDFHSWRFRDTKNCRFRDTKNMKLIKEKINQNNYI